MGSGIAQVAAQSGFTTILYELNEEVLARAKIAVDKNLGILAEKRKITIADKENTLQRIRFTSKIEDCSADIFIEAIIERPEAKIDLFNQLTSLNGNSIFASNTSSLSVTAIAKKIKNPERMIGMHFFNPAPLMKLVEIVKTDYTSANVAQAVIGLAKKMNKVPVACSDSPGFIVNRVARPYYIESLRLVEEGLIELAQLDSLMEATGFKMGPFKLMDLIGNDVNYAVSCSVYEQLNQPERLKPSFIQKEKVEKAELGKKSGKGYYNYS